MIQQKHFIALMLCGSLFGGLLSPLNQAQPNEEIQLEETPNEENEAEYTQAQSQQDIPATREAMEAEAIAEANNEGSSRIQTYAYSPGLNYPTRWEGTQGNRTFYNGYGEKYGIGNALRVIDVSEHNGVIDWNAVYNSKEVDAVIVRVAWGWGGRDLQAKRNISELNRLGIPYGVYLYSYARNESEAAAEARFLDTVMREFNVKLSLPAYYDLERWPNGYYTEDGVRIYCPSDSNTYTKIVNSFMNTANSLGRNNVHVYSYTSYVNSMLKDPSVLKYVSWIAEYGNKLNCSNAYYNGVSGWQCTSSGSSNGFYGDFSAFHNFGTTDTSKPNVFYQGHVQNRGWIPTYSNGVGIGNAGDNKQIEAFKIGISNVDTYKLNVRVHVQNYGWMDYQNVNSSTVIGTVGKNLRIEAINMTLENVPGYKLQYQAYIPGIGWSQWTDQGKDLGTVGAGKRIESLRIRLVTDSTVEAQPGITYATHVQNVGWMNAVSNEQVSGTTGRALRLEALSVLLTNAPANATITGQLHIQNYGWVNYSDFSKFKQIGTSGKALRLEALNFTMAGVPGYKLQYRVHIQNTGWTNWIDQGNQAGTTGKALRLEAIQFRLVKI